MLLSLFMGIYWMSSLPIYFHPKVFLMFIFPCILPYIAMHYEKWNWMNNMHIKIKSLYKNILYTLYCILYPLYSVVCTVYFIHLVLSTLYSGLCITYSVYSMLCTFCTTRCSVIYTLYCMFHALYLIHYVLCVLYSVHSILCCHISLICCIAFPLRFELSIINLSQLYPREWVPDSLCSRLCKYRLFTILVFKLNHFQILKPYACYGFVYATTLIHLSLALWRL